jgi:plastocyanin
MFHMPIRFPVVLAASCLLSTLAHAQSGGMIMSNHHIVVIDIAMSDYAFTPNKLDLLAGSQYELHFTNAGSKGHDFASKELFAAVTVAPEDRAKVEDGGVDVDGGATVDVRITANKPGTYNFRCTHFMHATFGMTGTAVIK